MQKKAHLVLLRHGKSVWNEKNLFTGWVDIPLSTGGIEEAFKAGDLLAHIPFDIVYCSALIRAQMTAMLALSRHHLAKVPCILHEERHMTSEMTKIFSSAAEKTTLPVVISWHLNERMYGQLQGLNKDDVKKQFGEEQFKLWRRSYDGVPPSGESLKMTAERTLPYFKKVIIPSLENGHNVLIVAHGNSLRSIVMELDHLDRDEVVKLEIPTGEPICYAFTKGGLHKTSLEGCLEK